MAKKRKRQPKRPQAPTPMAEDAPVATPASPPRAPKPESPATAATSPLPEAKLASRLLCANPQRVPLPSSPIKRKTALKTPKRGVVGNKVSKRIAKGILAARSVTEERLRRLASQLRNVQESILDDALVLRNLAADTTLPGPVATTLEMMEGGLEATAIEVQRIMNAIFCEETSGADSEVAVQAHSLAHMAAANLAQ